MKPINTTDSFFRHILEACSAVTILLGTAGLLGWTTSLHILASLSFRYIPMAPLTAAGFVLLGSALSLQVRTPSHRTLAIFKSIMALLVCVVAILKLAEFFSHAHFGFEEWIIRHPVAFGAVPTARLSPITTL
jgi:hypothetical protein